MDRGPRAPSWVDTVPDTVVDGTPGVFMGGVIMELGVVVAVTVVGKVRRFLVPDSLDIDRYFVSVVLSAVVVVPVKVLVVTTVRINRGGTGVPGPIRVAPVADSGCVPPSLSAGGRVVLGDPWAIVTPPDT